LVPTTFERPIVQAQNHSSFIVQYKFGDCEDRLLGS
jgi:hypothetical protein